MKYTVNCQNSEEAAFLDAIIRTGLLNIKKDWLKENFPNIDSYKFNITYKIKNKSKQKRKPKQLPGQLDIFDIIDKENNND